MTPLLQRLRRLFGGRNADDTPIDASRVAQWIAEIRAARLSYCGPPKLENLAEAANHVRAGKVRGRWLEAGVALGGSAILLAKMKPAATPLDLYDVFGLIPPPSPSDGEDAHARYAVIASGESPGIGGDRYYGYETDLLAKVKANLRTFDVDCEHGTVRCVPGLFEDTLRPHGPVALAHIDCDWYDSVRVCIERLEPNLVPGAVVVFDDWSSYSGCKRAVQEWRTRDPRLQILFERRSLGLVRAR
ncbi:MAG: class I SAM-dependent methyltransferase [Planctomycetes bacterium]|nr:class I SAM-dependent methyltransferase [Planctomycetota bacterium]